MLNFHEYHYQPPKNQWVGWHGWQSFYTDKRHYDLLIHHEGIGFCYSEYFALEGWDYLVPFEIELWNIYKNCPEDRFHKDITYKADHQLLDYQVTTHWRVNVPDPQFELDEILKSLNENDAILNYFTGWINNGFDLVPTRKNDET